ncbi:MAG: beta-glucosidase [Clostridiales bacterium]|nr:beta-glucosidase [Clostridiales bacterium]
MKKRMKMGTKLLSSLLACSLIVTSFAPMSANAATTSNVVSQREIAHAKLAREAAGEGMVLLENKNQALPLKGDLKKIALFGGGAARTIRGGTGSGDPFNGGLSGGGDVNVNQSERYHINIWKAFLDAGYDVTTQTILDAYAAGYDTENQAAASNPMATFSYPEMEFTESELTDAAKDTDTAIYVISRNAGEGADRQMTKTGTLTTQGNKSFTYGDYELTQLEKDNINRVADAFDRTIVVLNVGGVIDTKFFRANDKLDALLLMGQAGQEAGAALVDVLTGTVTPSGKLTDTWAVNYSDYPASDTFSSNDNNVAKEVYNEGIYVGYRYFDSFNITPAYAFGFGKSYTDFNMETTQVSADESQVTVTVQVTNTGNTYSGKEVVEVYFSAPDTTTEKAYQELGGYAKTDSLAPGQSQNLTISFATSDMSYYDESKSAYVLDNGAYLIRVGNSSRNTKVVAKLTLSKAVTTEQLSKQLPASESITEISKKGEISYSYKEEANEITNAKQFSLVPEKFAATNHASAYESEEVTTYTTDASYTAKKGYEKVKVVADKKGATLYDVAKGSVSMEELVAQMSLEELAKLNCGSGWGVANESAPIVGANSSTVPGAAGETVRYDQYGIPSIVLADGPGGIRVKQSYEATNVSDGVKANYYQYCTAWPVASVLAQTWDNALIQKIGIAFGVELAELNITLLLGPGLNIHRDPLCGRNFEYFSEDPLISGEAAAAVTLGVQSIPGVGACLKHYVANNQENNRNAVDTIVSERALREIYLKGFEIAVKASQPMSIMTSYNLVNGVPTADYYDLNTNIARGEWGFNGLIMTDWNGGSSSEVKSMHAGNDMIMPGGIDKANGIIGGVTDVTPTFDEKGQVALQDSLFYMFPYKKAAWGEFVVSKDGTKTVEANLEGSNIATVSGSSILVNGEAIYREYTVNYFGSGSNKTALTTDVATVTNGGKTIVYKGDYPNNNIITLGDVQKSAIHNLAIIMRSNDMVRRYPDLKAKAYSGEFADLVTYQSVIKSAVYTQNNGGFAVISAPSGASEAGKEISLAKVVSQVKAATITGEEITPDVNITVEGKKLVKGKDYELSYQDNDKVGIATIIIQGIGEYSGTTVQTFKILPKQVSNLAIKKDGGTAVFLSWKKEKDISGYLVYRYDAAKKTYVRVAKVSKNKTSFVDKKVKANKTYQYKVKTYKKVDGIVFYGKASKKVKIKIKEK